MGEGAEGGFQKDLGYNDVVVIYVPARCLTILCGLCSLLYC